MTPDLKMLKEVTDEALRLARLHGTLSMGAIYNEGDCGSVGCVMGWAGAKGLLPGVTFEPSAQQFRFASRSLEWDEAAAEIFGLSPVEAMELFCPLRHEGPDYGRREDERIFLERRQHLFDQYGFRG